MKTLYVVVYTTVTDRAEYWECREDLVYETCSKVFDDKTKAIDFARERKGDVYEGVQIYCHQEAIKTEQEAKDRAEYERLKKKFEG